MHLFFSKRINGNIITLSKDESHHLRSVLRLKKQHLIFVTNGNGSIYESQLIKDDYEVELKIIDEKKYSRVNAYLHIALAPTKSMNRIEWFIEKATEIGVDEISFIKTKNTLRNKINLNRILKISISAIKQSNNPFLPKINDLISYEKFLRVANSNSKYIAILRNDKCNHLIDVIKNTNTCIMIGPEGDFDSNEIDIAESNNYKFIHLGKNTLRTETAAVYASVIFKGRYGTK